jgi:hypothetical protein
MEGLKTLCELVAAGALAAALMLEDHLGLGSCAGVGRLATQSVAGILERGSVTRRSKRLRIGE